MDALSSSLYARYSSVYDDQSSESLIKSLGSKQSDATDEEMLKACKEFEQYFIEQVIKEVKKTIPKDDLLGDNEYMNMFEDQMFQGVAEKITESGEIGLAKQLYDSMVAQTGGRQIKYVDNEGGEA